MPRDFRHFRPAAPVIGSLETTCGIAKARHWRAFLQSVEAAPRSAPPPGWRRSADRTGLQTNSLLTGNFTGKFAISGLPTLNFEAESTAAQRLFAQFPTRINRENILKNREFCGENRESYSRTLFLRSVSTICSRSRFANKESEMVGTGRISHSLLQLRPVF